MNVRIVGVGAARADDKKITTAGTVAKPNESFVQIGAAANQAIAWMRGYQGVVGITDAEVAVGRRVRGANSDMQRQRSCADEREGKSQSR